jgi:RND family efflux transporter MFP subunit
VGTAAAAPPPVPTVTVAQPLERTVTEWDDYVGRFEASKTVEVRPRVSGAVTAIHFTDGVVVQKGQLLFTIDPRPFTAALAEARAGLATADSDLALARANLERANRLVADDAISKSDLDQLAARLRAAVASKAAAQARVRARQLDVEFTAVRAPISGRISDRRIDAGNLVAGGDTSGTLLTTINALDPIYFAFDGSEALFLKSKRAAEAGAEASPVQVRLQDEADYRWQGRLDFTDRHVRQHAPVHRRRAPGVAGARRSGADRPGAQDRADRGARRHRGGQAGRPRPGDGGPARGARRADPRRPRGDLRRADGDARHQGAGARRPDHAGGDRQGAARRRGARIGAGDAGGALSALSPPVHAICADG